MIKPINRCFELDLHVREVEVLDARFVRVHLNALLESARESDWVLGVTRMEGTDGYVLDRFGYSLVEQEKIILLHNVATALHEQGVFGQGFVLSLAPSDHRQPDPPISEIFKTIEEWGEARKLAERELTYFNRHLKTRKTIERFAVEVSRSATTQRSYRFSMEKFFEYVIRHHYALYPDFDESVVNGFLRHLQQQENRSVHYTNRLFSAILAYCKFLGIKFDRQQAAEGVLPKLPKPIDMAPRNLEDPTVARVEESLIAVLESKRDRDDRLYVTGTIRDAWRNLLIFRLCVDGCLQLHEVLGLDFKDVAVNPPSVTVNGQDPRTVPLPTKLAAELVEYTEWRMENDITVELEKQLRYLEKGGVDVSDYIKPEESEQLRNIREKMTEIEERNEKGDDGALIALALLRFDILARAIHRMVDETFEQLTVLFVSNRYRRIAPNTVQVMFKKMGVSAEDLRQTGIKRLVDSNVPLHHIQRVTGKRSAELANRYSPNVLEDVPLRRPPK